MLLPASALLEPLRHHSLLTAVQLRETERLIAALPTATAVTAELVSRGWLTAYQGDELSAGRGFGLVVGQYVLLERLGRGGMGEVFRARNRVLKREVALKRMKQDWLDEPDLVKRFLREAEAAAKLSHPNVVQVHDAGDANGTLYLAMELLSGADLAKRLRRQGRLPVAEAIECVRQACEGMQHAHEQGLVHRDLKPANLMLTDEQQIKVLDMGLALMTEASALTHTGDRFGTWDYMAPEQASDPHQVDIRADVFSLGCTLYHLLAGRTPFVGSREAPALRPFLHLTQQPPRIEDLREDVPREVAEAVRKMMAKQRERRHQTPGEAAAVLGSLLRSGGNAGRSGPAQVPQADQPAASSRQLPTAAPERSRADAIPGRSVATGWPREFTNSIGMRFVLVEPGAFLMGSPQDEADRGGDEQQHEVRITRAFWLGVCPVTQGQWKAVMGSNPSYFSRTGGGKDRVRDISDADLDLFPVESISWEDAQDFLKGLTALNEEARNGRQYRLPSEAEWEYSCRGGHLIQDLRDKHTSPFHFDQPTSSLHSSQANFDGNHPYGSASKGPYLQRPCQVGSYKPNALGLFDLHGNVWEWCQDWYGYYPQGPVIDPSGPPQGSYRVDRGGCWDYGGRYCRAAYRGRITPSGRDDYLGFRVAAVPHKVPSERFSSVAEILGELEAGTAASSRVAVQHPPAIVGDSNFAHSFELDTDHSLSLFQGSLVHVRADALVSSDDNFLSALSGVARVLAQVAGPEVHRERQQLVGQRRPALADVLRTSGGGLPCRYLYHAITVEYGPGWSEYGVWRAVGLPAPPVFIDGPALRQLVVNLLRRATSDGVRSIGMPAFGTGAAHFPVADAARIILDELMARLVETPIRRVTLALPDDDTQRLFHEQLVRSRH